MADYKSTEQFIAEKRAEDALFEAVMMGMDRWRRLFGKGPRPEDIDAYLIEAELDGLPDDKRIRQFAAHFRDQFQKKLFEGLMNGEVVTVDGAMEFAELFDIDDD